MKKSKFTEEQIAYALRQVEGGTLPADVCRQLEVSEATFYLEEEVRAPGGQRTPPAAIPRGRERAPETTRRRPVARQTHPDRGATKKV